MTLSVIPSDKAYHFLVGLIATSATAPVLGVLGGFAVSVMAGFAKEGWDEIRGRGWDFWDVIATVLGGATAAAIFSLALLV